MADRILTTHVGSLPRPQKLLELSQKKTLGEKFDEAAYDRELKDAVAEVVRKQKDAGVDLINDGELGHTVGWAYDYGAWWSYVIRRLAGVEVVDQGLWFTTLSAHTKTPMAPKDFIVGDWGERRDMAKFQEAYLDPHSGCGLPEQFMTNHSPLVKGPIKYKGQDLIQRDIANFKAGLKAAGLPTEGAWMNAIAPASCARMPNEYYKTEEELLYACADAMHDEYKAIIDAGLIVQLDDPAIGENWDQQKNEPSVEGYRRYTKMQIDARQPLDQGAAVRQDPLPSVLGQLARPAHHRHSDEAPGGPDAGGQLRLLFLRGRQRPPRARVEAVEERQAARRQEDPARHRQPLDQPDRGPRTRRRPDHPLRRGGRPRERHRLDRLRPRRPRASADRLGQAQGALRRRGAGHEASLAASRGVSDAKLAFRPAKRALRDIFGPAHAPARSRY